MPDARTALLVADLNYRHLGALVRISSEDGSHGIAGQLDCVQHEKGEPSSVWVIVTPENNVEVKLDPNHPVTIPTVQEPQPLGSFQA